MTIGLVFIGLLFIASGAAALGGAEGARVFLVWGWMALGVAVWAYAAYAAVTSRAAKRTDGEKRK